MTAHHPEVQIDSQFTVVRFVLGGRADYECVEDDVAPVCEGWPLENCSPGPTPGDSVRCAERVDSRREHRDA
jgi:hypothetical protein